MDVKNEKILCVGEVLWDILPNKSIPGGAPMNVAMHLSKLGYKPKLASSVGNDEEGKNLVQFLKQTGIDISLLQVNNILPTSKVTVKLDEDNNATYEIVEPVAWDQIALTTELEEAANYAKLIIYGSLAARNEKTRNTILSVLNKSSIKLMDVNLRPPYNQQKIVEQLVSSADIVKMNEEELFQFKKWHNIKTFELDKLVLWFSNFFNINQICVTRGKNGALIYNQGLIVEHPGYAITAVDTVGSGDAFLAGFIHCFTEGRNSQETINYACALGAFVATRQGATPEYRFVDINEFLNSGKLNSQTHEEFQII